MKRWYRYTAGAAAAALLALSGPAAVYGGDINGNEQELLNIISGTREYNGQIYKVKDSYISQARSYFLQDDVNITDSQKQEAIQRMYASIGQGVAEGYLEPVEAPSGAGSGEAGASGRGTGAAGNGQPGAGTSPESVEETTVPETTIAPVIRSLQQITVTEQQEPVEDFPLEAFSWEYPAELLRTAAMTVAVCLALTAGYSLRSGLFHHHHEKRGKRK